MLRVALRWVGMALGLSMLGVLVSRFDWVALERALSNVRFGALLLIAPFALMMTLDALAWRRLLRTIGHPLSLADLLPARLIGEALTLSLPAGAGVAESVLPGLVHARTGVPALDVLASNAAKRWTVMRAHAAYVVCGGALGFGALRAHARELGTSALPYLVIASALLPLVTSLAIQGALSSGVLDRAHRLLSRFVFARGFIEHAMKHAKTADANLVVLARSLDPAPTLLLLGAWLCESLEAFLILRLLGAQPDFTTVLALEAGLSVVRSAAFFAPAGLGVQDLGYLRGFEAFGFGDVAAAFVLVKRSRELVVAMIGWTLLGVRKKTLALAPA